MAVRDDARATRRAADQLREAGTVVAGREGAGDGVVVVVVFVVLVIVVIVPDVGGKE